MERNYLNILYDIIPAVLYFSQQGIETFVGFSINYAIFTVEFMLVTRSGEMPHLTIHARFWL